MVQIEVTPESLHDAAGRLRSTHVIARRATRVLAGAGPAITGSVALSAALSEHSDAWEWCLQRLHDRLVSGSRALDGAALAYEQLERSVVAAVHNPAESGHGSVVGP